VRSTLKKAKQFIERQLIEYEIKIKKLKKRRKIVKALFVSLIIISVTNSTVSATIAGLALPPAIIPVLSSVAGLTTVSSVKFNLEGKKQELNKTIHQLERIKQKIDYVVSCNGNFTTAKYRQIIEELAEFPSVTTRLQLQVCN
jgi:hypothetical protein